MFELVGQSSDLMIRARHRSLGGVFGEAARGVVAAMAGESPVISGLEERRVVFEASRLDDLLQDFLAEVLHWGHRRWIVGRVDASVVDVSVEGRTTWRLEAGCWGEPWDMARIPPAREVKAVTYQGLRVEQVDHEWIVECVVDL